MHEGDPVARRPGTWHLVYQTVSGCPARFECRVEIGNPVADVVDARASPGEEFPNGTVRMERREQLNLGIPQWKRHNGGAIDCFGRMRHDAKDVPIKSECRFQVGDGDSDMRDAGEIGHWSLPIG